MDEAAREDWMPQAMLRALATGLAAFVLAWLSLTLTSRTGGVAAIWPGNAVVLAIVVRSPRRSWPLIGLASLVGMTLANASVGRFWLPAIGLPLCNLAEIAICAIGLRWLVGPKPDLLRQRAFWIFAALALLGSLTAALLASEMLGAFEHRDIARTLAVWTMADVLGLLMLTPALLGVTGEAIRRAVEPGRWWRSLGVLALLAAIDCAVFSQTRYPLAGLVWGGLLLVVFELEALGAAVGLVIMAAISIGFTLAGRGPAAAHGDRIEQIIMLQASLVVAATISLAVSATLMQRRQFKDALTDSEARYRQLTERSSDIIMRSNSAGVIEYISPACRQLGYAPGEMIGREVMDFLHPDGRAVAKSRTEDLFSGRPLPDSVRRVYCVICKSGELMWLEGRASLVRDAAGTVVAAISHMRDVTERRAAEQAMAQSEARYRLLAENATDIIIRYDRKGVIEFASPAVRQLGYEPLQVTGRNMAEFVHPEDHGRTLAHRTAVARGAPPSDLGRTPFRGLRADGSWVWLQGNPSPIFDDAGRAIGAVTVIRDVTARVAMEDELRRKQAEAEAAAVAKGEFLANMSHEIRTPLTAIIGFGGLLDAVGGLPPTAATYVRRIVTASQSLLGVVNDVLDFSKLEARQIVLDPQPFDPAAFVAETVELVADQASAKGLAVRCEVVSDLPAAVDADSSRLRQIMLNLLGNAVKFTNQGGVSVEVSYAAQGAGALRVAVTDTGVGIPQDLLGRLFQRFSQVDGSTTREFGGTGLGLAICKNLVEIMGGDIGVQSQVGVGSTFWFTIQAPPAELARPALARAEPNYGIRAARILVVDDVAVNRELVRTMLGAFGHDITEAASGSEAVEAAMLGAFDLILMDLQMPGMDGLAATHAIRKTCDLNLRTPILALSANVLPEHREACRAAGMNDHIAKPIDAAELLTKVSQWTAPTEDAALDAMSG
ncbi:MAG: PAS domain S-box protein [Caulobacterales bacterium]